MLKRTLSCFILSWTILVSLALSPAYAQTFTSKQDLKWQIKANIGNPKINATYFLNFPGAAYSRNNPATPVFEANIPVSGFGSVNATLVDAIYVKEDDPVIIGELKNLTDQVIIQANMTELDHNPLVAVSFIPIRKNPANGVVELLKSFTISLSVSQLITPAAPVASSKRASSGSLLGTGTWYKFGLTRTGIYKLDYNFLKTVGISANTNMSNIKIYGRAGGMLPEPNAVLRDSDLVQNAVYASSNGPMGSSDYILFYAKGPTAWTYDTTLKQFHHQINYYSDTAYYFITADGDAGSSAKRILPQNITAAPTNEITGFTAYDYHELDTITALTMEVKSGREWYGEAFSAINTDLYGTYNHYLSFNFPQADLKQQAFIRTSTAIRAYPYQASFSFSILGNIINTNNVGPVPSTDAFANEYAEVNDNASSNFTLPATKFSMDVLFNPGTQNDLGWIDYVEFNVPSILKYIPGQFGFRNPLSIGQNLVNRYHIAGASLGNFQVWDVTDFHNVKTVTLSQGSGELTFNSMGDQLREFVANDGSGFYTPTAFGKVPNQNIHNMPQPDMVIVAYPDFIPAADSLAAYHKMHDNMVVDVVTPQQVYNEFSSGTQDVCGIRDMMKMFYDRGPSTGKNPGFLLLIGAASIDYKNRIKGNTNFVPTYEGYYSLWSEGSFCSDDYYTLLGNNEGNWPDDDYDASTQILQLSVGRMPVYNTQQAMDVVHKTIRYNNESKCMNDWRNKLVFIADDRESNTFVSQTETLTVDYIAPQHPELNITKLYLDATPEVNTAAGQLFPQINTDIDNNMTNGCLVMDYIGHGGPQYLAVEKVMTLSDINSWVNPYNMPLLITATCQFGTFDDPTNVSAGDQALLNPNGGPFALYSTTRAVEITANELLNQAILNNNLFEKEPKTGLPQFIGSAFTAGKNNTDESNGKSFALLGDPAIRLALPQYNVKVTNISKDSMASDTFKALSLMTVSGEVVSGNQVLTSFNGDIYPTVFDKPQTQYTLGQAAGDPADPDWVLGFSTQNNVIYKGHTSVKNGKFTFQFVVPRDISFAYGKGKISFYADNGIIDANGYTDSLIVGGSDTKTNLHFTAPHVKLFMNDTSFMDGDVVNQNPVMLARVYTQIGINTLGSIGHNLTAVLDSNGGSGTYILNNYYAADKGTYKSGTIAYPFFNLSNGKYHLTVTVWDVDDSSASTSTDFLVVNSSNLTIGKIFNYPNPFTDITTFGFDDNEPNKTLHVDISIYDMHGKLIRDLQSDVMSAGDQQLIQWNGTTYGGATIAQGMYVYRLTVSDTDGQVASKSQKLIFIK